MDEPPHVTARFHRRRCAFLKDMGRFGFRVIEDPRDKKVDIAYLPIRGGDMYIVLDLPRVPPMHNPTHGFSGRYWPAGCRVIASANKVYMSGTLSMRGWHFPPIPEALELENLWLVSWMAWHRFHGNMDPDPRLFTPWVTICSGIMRGPPHFEDFLLQWDSPLGALLDDRDKHLGWSMRFI